MALFSVSVLKWVLKGLVVSMAKESDLRFWLKLVMGKDELRWVEAGFGGTDGQPDVNIGVGHSLAMPTELKMWKPKKPRGATALAIECKVRPVQIRYHVMEGRAGRKTAFLVGVERDFNHFDVYAFPGSAVPITPYPGIEFYAQLRPIAVGQERLPTMPKLFRTQIIEVLGGMFTLA